MILFRFAFPSSSMEIFKKEFSGFLPDLPGSGRPSLNYGVSHQELLRNSLNDSLLSRYTLRQQEVQFYYPAADAEFQGIFRRSLPDAADLLNSEYLSVNFQPVHYAFLLSAAFRHQDWYITPSIRYAFSVFSDTAYVLQFPRSENAADNTYFFNLLPQTFGDTLPFRNTLHQGSAALNIRRDSPKGPLFFAYRYDKTQDLLTESHINKSNTNLAGPRESHALLKRERQTFSLAWQFDPASLISIEYRFTRIPLDWRHRIFPDTPDTLEIVKLAESLTKEHAFRAAYRYRNKGLQVHGHAGGGSFNGELFVSTPVLGYLFRILPISHQGIADASVRYGFIHAFSEYPIPVGVFTFTPRMDLNLARIYSDLNADAQLEFGLQDIRFSQAYIHAFFLTAAGLRSEVALNRELRFYLDIEQALPFIKTVYPEIPPPPPPDIRRYGGLSVCAGVSLAW